MVKLKGVIIIDPIGVVKDGLKRAVRIKESKGDEQGGSIL